MGNSAIILGVICLITWWFVNPFVGIPFGIASFILARKEKHRRSVRNIGLLVGVIGLAISTTDAVIIILNSFLSA